VTRYLSVAAVIAINAEHGGPGAGVRDVGTIEAQVHRPQHAFGDQDAHPSLWDKAAALLHGLARTQGFHDGNKRTAWLAARAFLEVNGHPLRKLPPSTAHAVMLAISANMFDLGEVAEWLREHEDPLPGWPARHPQLDFATLTRGATASDNGTYSLVNGDLAAVAMSQLPYPFALTVLCRVFWTPADEGRPHTVQVEMYREGSAEVLGGNAHTWVPPVRGGHAHHPHGLMPGIAALPLVCLLQEEGKHEVLVILDDSPLARLPLNIAVSDLIL
jgi:prophage maintenance system killer protein